MKYYFTVFLLFIFLSFSYGQNGAAGFSMPSLAPVVQQGGTILFRLKAPAARQVSVKMDGAIIPMQKNKGGIWSGTSGKLDPDIYIYTYLVDSLSMIDPSNPLMRSDYNGASQSLITVTGTPPEELEIQNVAH